MMEDREFIIDFLEEPDVTSRSRECNSRLCFAFQRLISESKDITEDPCTSINIICLWY